METTRRAARATTPDAPANASDREERLVGSDRVLAVLKELSRYPDGIGLEELTRSIGSPKPTVHRALRALRRAGLADQNSQGHYLLGDELLRMAFAHHEARPDHVRIRPVLDALATTFGETAHYAVLDGPEVVYRAKVDPPTGAVRLTSTIGGRNPAHATAVGKMLLADYVHSPTDLADWVGARELHPRTADTRCTVDDLYADIEIARARGYATEDQENETGINCLAVPVYLATARVPTGAVSISALTYRTPLATLVESIDQIRGVIGTLGTAP